MQNSTAQIPAQINIPPIPADYASMMLALCIEKMLQRGPFQLLDIGPVCGENIMFFGRLARRHYVCDLFFRLARNRREKSTLGNVWNHLDYPGQCFHGILLWDFLDHLHTNEARDFIAMCHRMLKANGLLMVTAFDPFSPPAGIYSFVIRNINQVTFRLQHHLQMARCNRSNREMISLLSGFRLFKSFIYRNGVREFLFQQV